MLGLARAGAAAERSPDHIAIGVAVPASAVDPHVLNASPNAQLAAHIFSRLVERDALVQLRPGLAREWRQIDATSWEFRLAEGVRWHDGRPFTATDVAFSLARAPAVPNSLGGYGGLLRMIAQVEVVDPLTIRVVTRRPHAPLPMELSAIAIVSRHAGQEATPEDYNSGRAAIGTGPYRLLSYNPDLLRVRQRLPQLPKAAVDVGPAKPPCHRGEAPSPCPEGQNTFRSWARHPGPGSPPAQP
jgi:peptide/nickel transport system substrate-binding protein